MVKTRNLTCTSWSLFPIHEHIARAIKENNLIKPLPIQAKALDAALCDNKNVLGAARTGSGKTLAYAIPVLNKILHEAGLSSRLKAKICKLHGKKEDFELIEGEITSVEDMIVDKPLYNNENEEDCTSDDEGRLSDTTSCASSNSTFIDYGSNNRICPDSIVLVPTRELAFQVKQEFEKLSKHTEIVSCCLVGGLSQDKQLRTLRKLKPHIIIATPGRLFDIVQSDAVEYLNIQSIASISTLVIDEADRMIQRGHFDELLKILDIIKESKKFRRDESSYKVYLYSATLTFLHELPDRLKVSPLAVKESRSTNANQLKKSRKHVDPKEHNKKNKIKQMLDLLGISKQKTKIIDLNDERSHGRPSAEQLNEFKINCLEKEKDLHLYYFLFQNRSKKTIIFCNSKNCLRRLSNVLKYLGLKTLKLHSDMDQKKRLASLEKFRSGSDTILIATDVAARGLDIKHLDCVIHYQVPRTCESYIHRSGRTARLNHKGVSLTLCDPKEVPAYRRICNNINCGKDLDDYIIDTKLRLMLKERVSMAIQCDKLDHELREKKSEKNWFLKAAKDCDIELDSEDLRLLSGRGKSREENLENDAKKRRYLNQIEKRLNGLMKTPVRVNDART